MNIIKDMTIVDQFLQNCVKLNKKIALEDIKHQYTFSDIYEYAGKISFYIRKNYRLYENAIGILVNGTAESIILILGVYLQWQLLHTN